MRILVIEDETTLNKNICGALLAENFAVERAFDGFVAERFLRKESFDCVVMDINLPKKNGYDLCKEFREHNTNTPVLMLTAFDELEDKIKGFDSGADDYLTKPFFMKELTMRVHSLLKRSQSKPEHKSDEKIIASDIVINTAQKKVRRQDLEIQLTPREYQILMKLCKNPGEIISKNDLIKEIWGTMVDTNTVEVYVNFLRNKIDKPFSKNSIKTKIGYGYYLSDE
ncbi:response regulator transcription factor [Haoranjiania flava]|uniref:Response regulator transcription factor n=1 Tax=Haoranjiania flava TaxID=1856322 RepID=A0AAE3IRZ0_9BACT|nr:response regulator transcription factor [Haoranjiania flava]MCU7694682.1 response regulator transcription factor [Haoranjiania flava]